MRKVKLLLTTITMTALLSLTAYAGQWQQDTAGWWYQNDDGSYTTNNWQEINGKQYYFNESGYMLANTTTPDGYQVGADGAWIANQEIPKFDFSIASCSVKYTKHEVLTADYDGYPCLTLYYDFTNNSQEAEGAWLSDYSIKVFQNGVECESTIVPYDDRKADAAFDNYTKDVLPGTTLNVAQAFRIKDMSDVTVQIKEMWSWSNPKVETTTLTLYQ